MNYKREPPLKISERVYKSIYAIDDCFDDNPARWKDMAQSAPKSIEDVQRLKAPCGVITGLISEGTFLFKDIASHPEFTKAFNGLVYLYSKAGEAGWQVDLEHPTPDNLKKLKKYSQLNLQASLCARAIVEASNGEIPIREVVGAMDTLLADHFVGEGHCSVELSLDKLPKGYEIKPPYFARDGFMCKPDSDFYAFDELAAHKSSRNLCNLLSLEKLNFTSGDWRDLLADLEVERKTGTPTPNLLATYIRCHQPDCDLQAWAAEVKKQFPSESRVTRITPEMLEKVNPELYKIINNYMDEYEPTHDNPTTFVDLDAKKLARSALKK